MNTKKGLAVFLAILLLVRGLSVGWSTERAEGAGEGIPRDSGASGSGDDCCLRQIMVVPFAIPEESVGDSSAKTAQYFADQFRESQCECPRCDDFADPKGREEVWQQIQAFGKVTGVAPDPELQAGFDQFLDLDYVFVGEVVVDEQTGFNDQVCDEDGEDCSGGNVLGHFTCRVRFVDPHHGVVIREAETSWVGEIDGISEGRDAIMALAQNFMPLDDLIYDYERRPRDAQIEPEKDEVMRGETIAIRLTDIVDGQGRPSQPWWRLFVKVDKGEILNGEEYDGEFRIFRVGESGAIEVQYEAPEECVGEDRTETVTVFNNCVMKEQHFPGDPEKEIASGEFEIRCPEFEIEYDHHTKTGFGGELWATGRVPVYVRVDKDGYYCLEGEGTVDLTYVAHIEGGGRGGGGLVCTPDAPGEGTIRVIVDGDLVDVGGDVYELYFTLEETWYDTWNTPTMHCEWGGPGGTRKTSKPWAVNPLTMAKIDYVFPVEDGYSEELSINRGTLASGKYTWTLHVLEE